MSRAAAFAVVLVIYAGVSDASAARRIVNEIQTESARQLFDGDGAVGVQRAFQIGGPQSGAPRATTPGGVADGRAADSTLGKKPSASIIFSTY